MRNIENKSGEVGQKKVEREEKRKWEGRKVKQKRENFKMSKVHVA